MTDQIVVQAVVPSLAYAIVGQRGNIHCDKITRSPAESWGLLVDEQRGQSVQSLRRQGWRCVKVRILPRNP